jgi:hypothetical protein
MKVVINKCFGGFGLSEDAYKEMGMEWDGYGHAAEVKRSDPKLVLAVEKLGDKANGFFAKLEVIEIPDGTDYTIEEYDGVEHVAETHATWG